MNTWKLSDGKILAVKEVNAFSITDSDILYKLTWDQVHITTHGECSYHSLIGVINNCLGLFGLGRFRESEGNAIPVSFRYKLAAIGMVLASSYFCCRCFADLYNYYLRHGYHFTYLFANMLADMTIYASVTTTYICVFLTEKLYIKMIENVEDIDNKLKIKKRKTYGAIKVKLLYALVLSFVAAFALIAGDYIYYYKDGYFYVDWPVYIMMVFFDLTYLQFVSDLNAVDLRLKFLHNSIATILANTRQGLTLRVEGELGFHRIELWSIITNIKYDDFPEYLYEDYSVDYENRVVYLIDVYSRIKQLMRTLDMVYYLQVVIAIFSNFMNAVLMLASIIDINSEGDTKSNVDDTYLLMLWSAHFQIWVLLQCVLVESIATFKRKIFTTMTKICIISQCKANEEMRRNSLLFLKYALECDLHSRHASSLLAFDLGFVMNFFGEIMSYVIILTQLSRSENNKNTRANETLRNASSQYLNKSKM